MNLTPGTATVALFVYVPIVDPILSNKKFDVLKSWDERILNWKYDAIGPSIGVSESFSSSCDGHQQSL